MNQVKTIVRVKAGRWRGRFGWIAGAIDAQNPAVTKVAVTVHGKIMEIAIADLEIHEQFTLPIESSTPERKTPPARGRRRFIGLNPW